MTTVETFAALRATLSFEAFCDRLGGPCVFVRLDERGGRDEPVRWAFDGLPALTPDHPLFEADIEDTKRVLLDGIRAEMPHPPSDTPLRVPVARERATVYLVPLPFTMGAHEIVIGRGKDAGVVVHERSVSKQHARLHVAVDAARGAVFRLQDAGSDNGVTVNGNRLKPAAVATLRSRDVIGLGDVMLLFLAASSFYESLPALTG